jgi:YD repeat-containing protein
MKLNLILLKRLNACEDALEFFEKNKLEGFDSDWIKDIPTEIKLSGYVEWLNDKFGDNCEIIEDNNNNELTYEDSDGKSWTKTYDENNNELTFKNSDGFSYARTYDGNGKLLSITENDVTFNIPWNN